MSAGSPTASRPTVGLRSTRAGTSVAAPTASSKDAPSACRFRTASSMVRVLPASSPSGPRATPSSISMSRPPRRYAPSPSPAPAIASVTSATRPAADRQTTFAVSGARWTPSRMTCTITSSRASAAPAMPGSRCRKGRIALKRCVTVRTPRSKAASASSAVASECPHETAISPSSRRLTSASAPGSSGARVTSRTGPASRNRSSSSTSGSRRAAAE